MGFQRRSWEDHSEYLSKFLQIIEGEVFNYTIVAKTARPHNRGMQHRRYCCAAVRALELGKLAMTLIITCLTISRIVDLPLYAQHNSE
jgi:hypothetical protein